MRRVLLTLAVGAVAALAGVGQGGAQAPEQRYDETVLVPTDAAEQPNFGPSGGGFGRSVAVAPDGTIATTAPIVDGSSGAVYVYRPLPDGSYRELKLSLADDPSSNRIRSAGLGFSNDGTLIYSDDGYVNDEGPNGAIVIERPDGDGYRREILTGSALLGGGWVFNGPPAISGDGAIAIGAFSSAPPPQNRGILVIRPDSAGQYSNASFIETDNPEWVRQFRGDTVLTFTPDLLLRLDRPEDPVVEVSPPPGVDLIRLRAVDANGNLYARSSNEVYVYAGQDLSAPPVALNVADAGFTGVPSIAVSESGRVAVGSFSPDVFVFANNARDYTFEARFRSTAELPGSKFIRSLAVTDEVLAVGLDVGPPEFWGTGGVTTWRTDAGGGVFPTPIECIATRNGDTVHVEWSEVPGANSFVISRTVDDGPSFWRGRTTQSSFVDTDRSGDLAYSVVVRQEFLRRTPVACSPAPPPRSHVTPACTFPSQRLNSRCGGQTSLPQQTSSSSGASTAARGTGGADWTRKRGRSPTPLGAITSST